MKELSIEQKARAYDEAIERANDILKGYNPKEGSKATVNYIFPELHESEDEKIKKRIIQAIKIREKEMNEEWSDEIAWIEKQDKKEFTFKSIPRLLEMIKPTDRAKSYCQKLIDSLIKEGYVIDAMIVGECLKQMNGDDVPMATMDEQKFVDNLKPKFKVGDWIISKTSNLVYHVDSILCKRYYLSHNGGIVIVNFADEQNYRLWTIQDAKDGDVLSYVTDEKDLWIMIYWSLYKPYEGHVHYHALLVNDNFSDKGTCCICIDDLKPATKEQRDLLFQKMYESGYEWDAKNKELNKIHIIDEGKAEMDHCFTKMMNGEKVSSTWSEEDEDMVRYIGNAITCKESAKYLEERGIDMIKAHRWLESFKLQPKQEWSEEDERRLKSCLNILQPKTLLGNTETINTKWLKSLKNRIQPQNLTVTDEELAKAKKDAYNEVLDKIEYDDDWPTFDDGWNAAIWYLKKRNIMSQNQWKPSKKQMYNLHWLANVKLGDSVVEQEVSKDLNELYEDLKKL